MDDQPVTLTPKEYGLLLLLAQNPGKTFSRAILLNTVWTEDFWGNDRTVDTHIKTLREKIRPYEKLLVTVRGFGYKLEL